MLPPLFGAGRERWDAHSAHLPFGSLLINLLDSFLMLIRQPMKM